MNLPHNLSAKELFDAETLNEIKDNLIKKKETIAAAESVTAGMLQLALSSADEAMFFFQGGITAYNLGQKYRHLLIEPIHAQSCNCISQKVADEMAVHVCDLFNSDWGIGITGYAKPVPESDNKLFAYYSIAYKKQVCFSKKITTEEADTLQVQAKYVNNLLKQLNMLILKPTFAAQ